MAQMRIKNVSGKTIRQLFEGKTYVLEPGDEMTLPSTIAGWMLRVLNNVDLNESLKRDKKTGQIPVVLEVVTIPPDEQVEDTLGIVRADRPAKKAEPASPPQQPAAAQPTQGVASQPQK